MEYIQTIINLTKRLFPTGRAFKVFEDSERDKLIAGLAESENRAYKDALSILNSILPDNDEFTADDATQWEIRLGLIVSPLVSLENRKAAIRRRLNHPGDIPARQNYRFVERELRLAGFDLYVHENRFDDGMGGYETRSPSDVSSSPVGIQQHGDIQHGDSQHGTPTFDRVVNYMEPDRDFNFDIGGSLRSTFFIGGLVVGDYADVEEVRRQEFRKLILTLKPTQTIAYLFINYI